MSEKALERQIHWRPIIDYEGLYEVSNLGGVRSVTRRIPHARYGTVVRHGYGKKASLDKYGYLQLTLSKLDAGKCFRVHRLVAEAFIGPSPQDRPCINHKDGNKLNNAVENLEWCSSGENTRHAHKSGLVRKRLGEEGTRAKLTNEQVREIRRLYAERIVPHKEIAARFGIGWKYVWEIGSGKGWGHIQ